MKSNVNNRAFSLFITSILVVLNLFVICPTSGKAQNIHTKSYPVTPGFELNVKNYSGSITYVGNKFAQKVEISIIKKREITLFGDPSDVEVDIEHSYKVGNKVIVRAASINSHKGPNEENYDIFMTGPDSLIAFFEANNGNISAQNMYGSLFCSTTNGNITLADISSIGENPIAVKAIHGEISAIDISGLLLVKSQQGNVVLTNIDATSKVKGIQSNVIVKKCYGNFLADIVQGNITCEIKNIDEVIHINNKAGNVILTLFDNYDTIFDVNAYQVSVRGQIPHFQGEINSKQLIGKSSRNPSKQVVIKANGNAIVEVDN